MMLQEEKQCERKKNNAKDFRTNTVKIGKPSYSISKSTKELSMT
jgi:hypothetical protein